MIETVELVNFRQHKELKLEFADGLNTLRGANEKGKSTVFEAISYALFGSRAARNNDLTTWGEPENSHKVAVKLNLNGKEFVITRSPRGAQVEHEFGTVTGQTDVTRFIEDQLDLKPGMGPSLMFASQGNIRGVLQAGGAETTRLIEQLANFDLIDQVIETLQTTETTGNVTALEQVLENLQSQLDGLEYVSEPSKSSHDEYVKRLQKDVEVCVDAQEQIKKQLSSLKVQVGELQKLQLDTVEAKSAVTRLTDKVDTLKLQLSELPEPIKVDAIDDTLMELRKAVRSALKQKMVNLAIKQFKSEGWLDATYTLGRRADFRRQNTELQTELAGINKSVADLEVQVRKLEVEKLTGSCSFCGQDFSDVPEVTQKNADIDAKIATLSVNVIELKQKADKLASSIFTLQAILNTKEPALDAEFFDLDENFTPAKPMLKAGLVEQPDGLTEANTALSDLESKVKQADDVEVRRESLKNNLASAERSLLIAKESLANLGEFSQKELESLQQQLVDQGQLLNTYVQGEQSAKALIEKAAYSFEAKVKSFQLYKEQQEKLTGNVKQIQKQIEDGRFNNVLIRRLRSVKPEIANKVWATLLGTISRYFSVMRGTPCVVSKVGGDFLVDGKAVSSLSGSTLDVLGLAIRIALVRTFLPASRVLLLDEPFAACDVERQTNSLGFLLGLGFSQVLVITHEDSSETVADQHIELG